MKLSFKSFSSVILPVTLIIILFAKLHLAIIRFVDPDEFAYLHWTYLVSRGFIPYKDFFMNFTPLFSWVSLPLMLNSPSSSVIVLARVWQFIWYALAAFLVFRISASLTKKGSVGLLAMIIFLVFPMTLDKSIDFRPDTLMTVLFLLSFDLLLEIPILKPSILFLSGLILGTSIAALPKIIYAVIGFFYLLIHRRGIPKNQAIFWVGFGTILPGLILFISLFFRGILSLAWVNIIEGSYLIKLGEGSFTWIKALAPVPLVYLPNGGPSLPWFVNTFFWIASIMGFVILSKKNFHGAVTILLFLVGGFASFLIFPTPYMQYFIPLTALASIFIAETTDALINLRLLPRVIRQIIYLIIIAVIIISFGQQYLVRVNGDSNNREQKNVIDNLLAISKPNETVYDMVGSYIFRPDGYYICCNIYSHFADGLNIKLQTLRDSLVTRQTKFIVQDRIGKSLWLPRPEDLDFINSHYLSSSYPKIFSLGQQFSCQNGSCHQIGLSNSQLSSPLINQFSIVIPENYKLTTNPPEKLITVNGKNVTSKLFLSPGLYNFSVPTDVSGFIIQLDR